MIFDMNSEMRFFLDILWQYEINVSQLFFQPSAYQSGNFTVQAQLNGIVVEIPGYQMEHFHVYRCIQQNNENIIKNLGTKASRVMKWYKNVSRWKEQ